MSISKDLFLAILSMDAYNRGYGAGLDDPAAVGGGLGVSDQTHTYQIANSTIFRDAVDSEGVAQAAGFYAIAYKVKGVDGIADGTTVISYRGTDDRDRVMVGPVPTIRCAAGRQIPGTSPGMTGKGRRGADRGAGASA